MSKQQDFRQIPLFPELPSAVPAASFAAEASDQAAGARLRLVSSGPGRAGQVAEEAARDRRIELDLLNRVKYF